MTYQKATSCKHLGPKDYFRIADHPARTLDGVDLGWPAFYHGPVMPDSQSSLEQAICHYHILEKLGGGGMGANARNRET